VIPSVGRCLPHCRMRRFWSQGVATLAAAVCLYVVAWLSLVKRGTGCIGAVRPHLAWRLADNRGTALSRSTAFARRWRRRRQLPQQPSLGQRLGYGRQSTTARPRGNYPAKRRGESRAGLFHGPEVCVARIFTATGCWPDVSCRQLRTDRVRRPLPGRVFLPLQLQRSQRANRAWACPFAGAPALAFAQPTSLPQFFQSVSDFVQTVEIPKTGYWKVTAAGAERRNVTARCRGD
jgi:hypothetical protein